jgi:ribosome-associated heat shock protein Hsp15
MHWSSCLCTIAKKAEDNSVEKIRIDKWLWAARFFKTRSLATEEVVRGRVMVNTQEVKASKEVQVGDTLSILQAQVRRIVVVKGISGQRGSAPTAQLLYEETADSMEARRLAAERHRLSPEPARTIAHGRPTKRDRRELDKGWGDRWSASAD